MEFSVEDLSSVKKTFHIEIPYADVAMELDNAYNELKKSANIKGFRKGKAPRSALERSYGKSVNPDVRQKLIQGALSELVSTSDYQLVGDPEMEPPDLDPKAAFKFDITIEVAPEIPDLDYKGFPLTRTNHKMSEDEVETQLKMAQKSYTDKRKISEDRPAGEGDFVLIDYQGMKDGSPVPEIPKSENFTMKIGTGVLHPDLDPQLIGMSAGEHKRIKVVFPAHHQTKAIAGAEITFHVEVKEILEEVLFELDDEFAKKLGPYETLDQVRDEIRKNLKEGYDKRIEQELGEQAFLALLDRNDFEIPETMIKYELDMIVSDIESSVAAHDKTLEDLGFTRENLAEEHRGTAIKQVKRHLLLNKLIKQEKLELSEQELDLGFAEMSKSLQQPAELLKKYYQTEPDKLKLFKNALLEKKAMNLIIDNSEITDKEPDPVPVEQEDTGETEEIDE